MPFLWLALCSFVGQAGSLLRVVNPQIAHLYEAVEPHMGTLVQIKLYARDQAQAQHAFRAAFGRIAQIDAALSDYQPNSELNRICRQAVGRPVRVSEDLFAVAASAQQLARDTDGAFDITSGPLTHLWREARKRQHVPDAAAIEAARRRCGYRKLHIDPVRHTLDLDSPDMQLDVGGIAKGYAADQVLAVLSELGIRSALVAASGDLAFSGAPPGEPGWRIGIDALAAPLVLTHAAVSTSGSSEQHLDAGGKRYSHIIDPKTGMGLSADTTVTVVARHGIDADAAATAISVLGRDSALAFLRRRPDLAALIAAKENSGDYECVASPGFPRDRDRRGCRSSAARPRR
jgi:FAD:protein FMN transferase